MIKKSSYILLVFFTFDVVKPVIAKTSTALTVEKSFYCGLLTSLILKAGSASGYAYPLGVKESSESIKQSIENMTKSIHSTIYFAGQIIDLEFKNKKLSPVDTIRNYSNNWDEELKKLIVVKEDKIKHRKIYELSTKIYNSLDDLSKKDCSLLEIQIIGGQ